MAGERKRAYLLVEDMRGTEVRCRRCDRSLEAGYPLVLVLRDSTRPDAWVGGVHVSDAVCVYCDDAPRLPIDGG